MRARVMHYRRGHGPLPKETFSDPVEACKKAMDYLARREYARGELLDKLTGFGFDPNVADAVIEQLVADGLQSDERFVAAFIRSRINQGKGPVRIRADLRDRGVHASIVELALEKANQDWCALAGEVRRRKFGAPLPDEFKGKARQMRFLQSRGFESDHIQAAVSVPRD